MFLLLIKKIINGFKVKFILFCSFLFLASTIAFFCIQPWTHNVSSSSYIQIIWVFPYFCNLQAYFVLCNTNAYCMFVLFYNFAIHNSINVCIPFFSSAFHFLLSSLLQYCLLPSPLCCTTFII